MSTRRSVLAACVSVGCLLMTSCQQSSIGSRTFPDAVVALQQVDPYYRPYFAAQNGANYSLGDQRAAFIKAAQTARGPMPAYEARPSGTKIHRKAKSSAKAMGKKASAAKAQGGKRAVSRGKTVSSSAGKGVRKAPAKKVPVRKASKAKKR